MKDKKCILTRDFLIFHFSFVEELNIFFLVKLRDVLQGFLENSLRLGSDAVLHTGRIEFNELSSCEVRRLNQFETADIIRIGLAVLHA